jgi:hypothetical protein
MKQEVGNSLVSIDSKTLEGLTSSASKTGTVRMKSEHQIRVVSFRDRRTVSQNPSS